MSNNFKKEALKRIEIKLKCDLKLKQMSIIEMNKDEKKYSDYYALLVETIEDLKHELLVIELLIIGESINKKETA